MTNVETTVKTASTVVDKQEKLLDLAIKGVEKTGDIITDFGNVASQYMEKLGPEVYDMLLNIVRLDGLSDLLSSGLWAILTCITFFVTVKKFHPAANKHSNEFWLPVVFGYILSFTFGITTLVGLFDVWLWAKIFAPELWIARELMSKVIQ